MMRILIYIAPILLLTSCWPSSISVTDKGGMPEEWKSFSVQTLENKATNAPLNYSVTLSESVKDGIQNNTRLLLNSETGKGEVFIEGSVNSYTVMPVAMQEGDNAAKNRLTVSAQFNFYISKPKEDKMTLNVTRFVDYDSNTDLGSQENALLEEISKQIVQDVINKLLSNW
jgi:outer membrane lipopolysaccharide assembly protein LptE/RlpB